MRQMIYNIEDICKKVSHHNLQYHVVITISAFIIINKKIWRQKYQQFEFNFTIWNMIDELNKLTPSQSAITCLHDNFVLYSKIIKKLKKIWNNK